MSIDVEQVNTDGTLVATHPATGELTTFRLVIGHGGNLGLRRVSDDERYACDQDGDQTTLDLSRVPQHD